MSTNVPGFQSFFRVLHHFVLAKLATSNLRVNAHSNQKESEIFGEIFQAKALFEISIFI